MNSDEVFSKLEPLLVTAIPKAMAGQKVPQPICILRLYYYDTHAPCTYLLLRTISKKLRAKILKDDGLDTLWSPGEDPGEGQIIFPDEPPLKDQMPIAKLFEQVYELLSESEEDNMPKFQQMLRKVCMKLNGISWSQHCEVTEDFVVAPGDGSRFFGGDEDDTDVIASVPADKLETLRSYELFFPEEEGE
jgi:hypothetical protein